MLRKVPLIVILGSTGTGKTKLSIELAERFGGEIISADSMQVYAGLDIVTAKVTKEEQSKAPHHLVDAAKLGMPFTVVHFRAKALPIINDLMARSKCPIVVGGTNYYIESLLWDILVNTSKSDFFSATAANNSTENDNKDDESNKEKEDEKELKQQDQQEQWSRPISSRSDNRQIHNDDVDKGNSRNLNLSNTTKEETNAMTQSSRISSSSAISELELDETTMTLSSSEQLHEHLKKIDPITANRIHPNNKRKIIRALQVFNQTGGIPLSTILEEQRSRPGGNKLGGPLRYPHTILFWMQCDQNVLNERLDKRVDGMLKEGLLKEVRDFYENHFKKDEKEEVAFTKGVLQTIGFKEFVPYLEKFDEQEDLLIKEYLQKSNYTIPELGGDDLPKGLNDLRNCLERLKLVTKRYSKKQIKWVRNRFLASKDRQIPPLYGLDTSDVSLWRENVYYPAVDVIESYIAGNKEPKLKPLERINHPTTGLNEEISNYCEICKRHFIGEFQWRDHLRSNKHKRAKEGSTKQNKKQKLEHSE